MPLPNKPLTYPGGPHSFFVDLHTAFSHWLRLVALVPLIYNASSGGFTYDDLCTSILEAIRGGLSHDGCLGISIGRMKAAVESMLTDELYFTNSDDVSNEEISSPSQSFHAICWVYQPSHDTDTSRISFAFHILQRINSTPGLSVSQLFLELVTTSPSLDLPGPKMRLSTATNGTIRDSIALVDRDRLHLSSPEASSTLPRPTVRVPISSLLRSSVPPAAALTAIVRGNPSLSRPRSPSPPSPGSSPSSSGRPRQKSDDVVPNSWTPSSCMSSTGNQGFCANRDLDDASTALDDGRSYGDVETRMESGQFAPYGCFAILDNTLDCRSPSPRCAMRSQAPSPIPPGQCASFCSPERSLCDNSQFSASNPKLRWPPHLVLPVCTPSTSDVHHDFRTSGPLFLASPSPDRSLSPYTIRNNTSPRQAFDTESLVDKSLQGCGLVPPVATPAPFSIGGNVQSPAQACSTPLAPRKFVTSSGPQSLGVSRLSNSSPGSDVTVYDHVTSLLTTTEPVFGSTKLVIAERQPTSSPGPGSSATSSQSSWITHRDSTPSPFTPPSIIHSRRVRKGEIVRAGAPPSDISPLESAAYAAGDEILRSIDIVHPSSTPPLKKRHRMGKGEPKRLSARKRRVVLSSSPSISSSNEGSNDDSENTSDQPLCDIVWGRRWRPPSKKLRADPGIKIPTLHPASFGSPEISTSSDILPKIPDAVNTAVSSPEILKQSPFSPDHPAAPLTVVPGGGRLATAVTQGHAQAISQHGTSPPPPIGGSSIPLALFPSATLPVRPALVVYSITRRKSINAPSVPIKADVVRVSYGLGKHKTGITPPKPPTRVSGAGDITQAGHVDTKAKDEAQKSTIGGAKGGYLLTADERIAKKYARAIKAEAALRDRATTENVPIPEPIGFNPPAERTDGDMPWDFGVDRAALTRSTVDRRPVVRVGARTGVQMIPASVLKARS